MDAIEALRTRRSVRSFVDRPVDRKDLETIVDCGRLAASANNLQPWQFVVVTKRETRQRIAALGPNVAPVATAGACIVVLTLDTKYYLEDGAAATQNLLVAACALGLGTVWIAGDKKDYAADLLRIIGAPPDYRLVSLVAVGYPAEKPRTDKKPLSDLLRWEHFQG